MTADIHAVLAGEKLKAPFPWFGGKSRVADVVWRAFGNVPNYVEPFAGSLAVLLGRPHGPGTETVNDLDSYVSNFWRSLRFAPDALVEHADWPVNEADLHARHRWLVAQAEFRERMKSDPNFYDPKIAGWWVWGICQWIGTGMVRGSVPATRGWASIATTTPPRQRGEGHPSQTTPPRRRGEGRPDALLFRSSLRKAP